MSALDDFSTSAGSPHPFMGVERAGQGGGAGATQGAGQGGGAGRGADEEPPRKRARSLLVADDALPLRRRILEHKLVRLNTLRERLTEQLSELYFLQAGGNMMDYAAWRKRPPAPALLAYLEARRPPSPPPAPALAPAPAPATPAPATPAPVTPAPAPHDEMVAAARAEAAVAARVSELSRAGLWAERRLPRVLEPPRPKTHWDYLLEEMAWLAQDFAVERKWKKQAAKKCARAVQKYFQDKATAAQKAEKAQEIQLKKIASFAAKEIRTFWSNVEKVVEWKRVRRVERARKEALDEQLSYIVDRSERYSRQLAANLHAPPTAPLPPRATDDTPSTPRALSEYSGESDSADDESTIAEQERAERRRDPPAAAELDLLREEADLDLDLLRAKYAAHTDAATESSSSSESESDSGRSSSASSRLSALVEAAGQAGADGESSERRVEAAAQLAASLQPRGTTLGGAGTPVPALLRGALREYQLVGLHWLATMHARSLNGILADEMGLGKTIQTIALLAHLAGQGGDWGPHLVVAPTSVVLNWELEFKRWCPALKLLTYYGTIKERKLKRVGWTKPNSFHVCITSYKLVVQDHQSFRRKRWKYLILDEAQNIKNFKSQRWQMLLNFQTERRLLLTGTPLQNSLLELWSLMHFLMPAVFASHSEFREWFTPLAGAVAAGAGPGGAGGGADDADPALVRRLHAVLRPFLLRRLKADVERQMPRKYEHVVMCRLARRQRALYDDFMSRARTRETLASGNLLSVINVLMQLRKVCNHPDLFEPRPVSSPLQLQALRVSVPALLLLREVSRRVDTAQRLGGALATLELSEAGAFPAHRARHLAPPRRLLEAPLPPRPAPPPPPPPPHLLRLHLRLVPRAPPSLASLAAPPPPLLPPLALPNKMQSSKSAPRSGGAGAGAGAGAAARLAARRVAALRRAALVNERRCWRLPLYGSDLRAAVCAPPPSPPPPLAAPSLALLLAQHDATLQQFSVCWAAARAPPALLCVSAGGGGGAADWRRASRAQEEGAAAEGGRALLRLFHSPASRQSVAFPHPRLLQYDCGKLQTLATLLRRLRAGGHRVLIFTQMTRVLDVLEAFLSLHGHTYLRLDGATRVDRRQPLVDRFNADRRVFAFILSTRSGGVGLNLTGADSVVFYDSDWNPTMDAQAQDRCHRIGQTRDVHVYRLVTAATVEENILRKAEQKRALGHLAIEDGHFTTSFLRADTIADLFGVSASPAAPAAPAPAPAPAAPEALDAALAAAEDEADAAAARAARAEAQRDLLEFDETVPLEDDTPPGPGPAPASAPAAPDTPAPAPADPDDAGDGELSALMKQLTPVEQYAMRLVESGSGSVEAERAALEEMRKQLREWERARQELRADPAPCVAPASPPLTYCAVDARTQVWISEVEDACMPMWAPPTPPAGPGDVYRESWSSALYRAGAAPERLLPAAPRPPRAADPRRLPPRPPRPAHAPLSLFERCGGRARARPHRTHHAAHAPPHAALEWTPYEDAALRRALRLQRLPAEPPPALTPNWEWCAELVGEVGGAYRGPRAARDRHDAVQDPERARRKQKKPARARRRDEDPPPPPLARLEAMRDAAERRRAAPKRRYDEPPANSAKHAHLLHELGVEYDAPPSPLEVAERRADRIAKEKLKASAPPGAAPAPPAASPAPAATPAPALASSSSAAAAPPAARIVVAGGAGPSETARRRDSAALLYRQQALARQHLKILHHAPQQGSSGSVTTVSGASIAGVSSVGAGGAGPAGVSVAAVSTGTLRTLHLQQLALRRATPPSLPPHPAATARLLPAGRAHPAHVVVAHLAPAPAPAPSPAPSPAPAPAAQQQPPADRQ